MKKTDGDSMKSRVQALTAELEQQVQELFDSEKYRLFLDAMAKFHHYSWNNTLLILMQCPHAEQVAGYATWKKLGRQVKTGEKGIRILVPTPVKIRKTESALQEEKEETVNEEKEQKLLFFKIGHVWDISQTEGPPLPSIAVKELAGDVAAYSNLMKTVKRLSPVPIREGKIEGGAKGYFSPPRQEIVIREGLSERHSFHTAVHELTHSLLNQRGIDKTIDRQTNEVIAESVSYVVCKALKIETEEYSCGYICGWSSGREMKELKTSLTLIRELADELIPAFQTEEKAEAS